jgi:hypothetical protein
MSKVFIANAFSLNMLCVEELLNIEVCPAGPFVIKQDIEEFGGFTSLVGHADTAEIFSGLLDVKVSCNRATYTLEEDHILYVGQYKGPRLPEGTTTLPEGATVEWLMVTLL